MDSEVRSLLFTQVHCLHNDQVLLMKRNRQPNLGHWVAPGGKIEKDEAPYECATRELREETGLEAHKIHLRGIVSVVMPTIPRPCIQFLSVVTDFSGQLVADEREGTLRWWPVDEVHHLSTPQGNSVWMSHVLDMHRPFYQAKYIYDSHSHLMEVIEHTTCVSQS
jgi:8-oxo-dGTP diphosphatase